MLSRPRLLHLHIRTPISYNKASILQDYIASAHVESRKDPNKRPPPPYILTFSTTPTYTLGRRENSVSKSQLEHLSSPVKIPRTGKSESAEVVKTLRGGQTTFHGPGQLVIYPIFSLRAPRSQIPRFPHENPPNENDLQESNSSRYRLSPHAYVRFLEESVILLLARYSIKGIRTENPGVWVSEEEKIAAIGIHIRQFLVLHGVAINIRTDLEWFDRIVACGLEGKKTTSIKNLLERSEGRVKGPVPGLQEVARIWVDQFAGWCGFDVEKGDVIRDVLGAELDISDTELVDVVQARLESFKS